MNFFIEESPLTFLIMTVIIAGGAAWLSGRALALGWRPYWQVVFYMVLLAAALRFFHWSLFNGALLSLHFYLVDYAVLLALASLGYRVTRTSQMVRQYRWLYERTSPVSWRERGT